MVLRNGTSVIAGTGVHEKLCSLKKRAAAAALGILLTLLTKTAPACADLSSFSPCWWKHPGFAPAQYSPTPYWRWSWIRRCSVEPLHLPGLVALPPRRSPLLNPPGLIAPVAEWAVRHSMELRALPRSIRRLGALPCRVQPLAQFLRPKDRQSAVSRRCQCCSHCLLPLSPEAHRSAVSAGSAAVLRPLPAQSRGCPCLALLSSHIARVANQVGSTGWFRINHRRIANQRRFRDGRSWDLSSDCP